MIEPDAAAPSSSVIRFVCMYDRLSVWFVGLFVSLSFFCVVFSIQVYSSCARVFLIFLSLVLWFPLFLFSEPLRIRLRRTIIC